MYEPKFGLTFCEIRQHLMNRVCKNVAMQGVVLAATFAVSHNVEEAKPLAAGSATTSSLQRPYADRDWGIQQASTIPPDCPVAPASYVLPEVALCSYCCGYKIVTLHVRLSHS